MEMTDKPMLTPAEAAVVIGVSVNALQKMRAANKGPAFVQMGRRIRYPRSWVLAYLEGHAVYTTESRRPRRTTTKPAVRRRDV